MTPETPVFTSIHKGEDLTPEHTPSFQSMANHQVLQTGFPIIKSIMYTYTQFLQAAIPNFI